MADKKCFLVVATVSSDLEKETESSIADVIEEALQEYFLDRVVVDSVTRIEEQD
jgi:hypothetical protein